MSQDSELRSEGESWAPNRLTQPAALRSFDSSQWYLGGVCVTITSVSNGMECSHIFEASSGE